MENACEAMGIVSDTLVEGMMTHSDHADLMRLIGLMVLTELHEDGYASDSKQYRKVRAMCIDHLDMVCPTSNQTRPKTLEAVTKRKGLEISAQDRRQLLKTSLEGWHAWENTAASRYAEAAEALEKCGEETLRHHVLKMQRSAEREATEAKALVSELSTCGWDMAHAFDMQR